MWGGKATTMHLDAICTEEVTFINMTEINAKTVCLGACFFLWLFFFCFVEGFIVYFVQFHFSLFVLNKKRGKFVCFFLSFFIVNKSNTNFPYLHSFLKVINSKMSNNFLARLFHKSSSLTTNTINK